MELTSMLKTLFSIIVINIVIKILNKKGISISKMNYSLKIFLGFILLGSFMSFSFLYAEHEYAFKEIIEPIVAIIIIYIILASLNQILDKPKINDFVGGLLIAGGIISFIAIILSSI